MTKPRRTDWVARVLARAGVLPQDQVDEAVTAGRVRLNGRPVRQPLAEVRPGDKVTLDGREILLEPRTMALLFNKPKGSVTAHYDKEKRPTVFSMLLPALDKKLLGYTWHAVGRLDVETTGALLFTNDEQLVGHVTSPSSRLGKRYLARVSGTIDETKLQTLRRGVDMGKDETSVPAKVKQLGPQEIELVLTEGRFHQAKRMLGAVGLPVLALHRSAIGTVTLEGVPEGRYRVLTDEEIRQGLGFSGS